MCSRTASKQESKKSTGQGIWCSRKWESVFNHKCEQEKTNRFALRCCQGRRYVNLFWVFASLHFLLSGCCQLMWMLLLCMCRWTIFKQKSKKDTGRSTCYSRKCQEEKALCDWNLRFYLRQCEGRRCVKLGVYLGSSTSCSLPVLPNVEIWHLQAMLVQREKCREHKQRFLSPNQPGDSWQKPVQVEKDRPRQKVQFLDHPKSQKVSMYDKDCVCSECSGIRLWAVDFWHLQGKRQRKRHQEHRQSQQRVSRNLKQWFKALGMRMCHFLSPQTPKRQLQRQKVGHQCCNSLWWSSRCCCNMQPIAQFKTAFLAKMNWRRLHLWHSINVQYPMWHFASWNHRRPRQLHQAICIEFMEGYPCDEACWPGSGF